MEICLFCGNRIMRREPCQCLAASIGRDLALLPELSFDDDSSKIDLSFAYAQAKPWSEF